MIHSLIVFRTKGEVLLSRFFEACDGKDEEELSEEELIASLLEATKPARDEQALSNELRVAVPSPSLVSVFVRMGALVLVLTGKGEYDELVLGEALRGVCELVAAQCEQVSENEFLGQHERFALLLDTALRHGQLQHLAGPALALLVSGAPPEPLSIAAIQQQRELERVSVPGHVLAKLEPKSSAKQPKANPKAAERRPVSTVVVKQTPKK